jgi:cation diffusion facilitator CzcD-associated flavoprotein CzcO
VLNTSIHGFHHSVNERSAFDDTPEERLAFFERMWASPGFMKFTSNYVDILANPEANAEWCAFIAAKIRSVVHDPDTAERLVPKDHRYGEKRPPYVAGYFEAFNQPHVSLIDLQETPMVRMTAAGIETTAGVREHDVIVWATGFDFGTGAMARMGIVGRDGVALTEHWADGPTTFLGLQTAGFPNLFFPGGPHAAAGNNPRYNGDQVDFVTEALVWARDHGHDVVEVTPEAEERWTRMMDKAASRTPFGTLGQYVGGNIPGKPKRYLLNAAGRPKLFEEIARVRETGWADFRMAPAPADVTPSRPG